MSNALEIDQSLSVSFGPVGSIDQKSRFVHSLNVTTFSVSIVVFARHLQGSQVMTNVALKPGIKPPQGNEELRNFFRGFGNSFMSSVSEGGEYYAVYTYFSQTREEQTELTASMQAHGIFNGGSVDASLQTKIGTFNSSVKTRISFDQNMSGIRNPAFPDSDNIIGFALAFPSLELTEPAIVAYEALGYERVPNFGAFQPIAKNRQFFVGNTVVDGLTKPLVQIQQLQNQIEWIEQIYRFYGGFSDSKLNDTAAKAKIDRDAINDMILAYEDDPTGSFTAPDLPSLANGTPELDYDIKRSESHGGGSGTPFDDVNVDTAIPQQTRISALQLRSGDRIDKLITTYTDLSTTSKIEHGGGGGGLSNVLNLRPDNVVVKIAGRSGSNVDRLTFTTSNGDVLNRGGGGGKPFDDFEVKPDEFLLGFAGRSNSEVRQIQFITGKLLPARWTPIPD